MNWNKELRLSGVIRSSFSPDKVGIIGAAALAIERYGR